MGSGKNLVELAHSGLDEAFKTEFEKVLDGAVLDLTTPDKDLLADGITESRQDMVRARLRNLRRAYDEIATEIDGIFGRP